jgi:hypothetical protein
MQSMQRRIRSAATTDPQHCNDGSAALQRRIRSAAKLTAQKFEQSSFFIDLVHHHCMFFKWSFYF